MAELHAASLDLRDEALAMISSNSTLLPAGVTLRLSDVDRLFDDTEAGDCTPGYLAQLRSEGHSYSSLDRLLQVYFVSFRSNCSVFQQ